MQACCRGQIQTRSVHQSRCYLKSDDSKMMPRLILPLCLSKPRLLFCFWTPALSTLRNAHYHDQFLLKILVHLHRCTCWRQISFQSHRPVLVKGHVVCKACNVCCWSSCVTSAWLRYAAPGASTWRLAGLEQGPANPAPYQPVSGVKHANVVV